MKIQKTSIYLSFYLSWIWATFFRTGVYIRLRSQRGCLGSVVVTRPKPEFGSHGFDSHLRHILFLFSLDPVDDTRLWVASAPFYFNSALHYYCGCRTVNPAGSSSSSLTVGKRLGPYSIQFLSILSIYIDATIQILWLQALAQANSFILAYD